MSTYKINDNGVDREMTDAEIKAHMAACDDAAKELAAQITALETIAAAKASARAKLKALGLTDAEIAALAG